MIKPAKFKKEFPAAISVFDRWAKEGKDKGMEKGHKPSVDFMFRQIKRYFNKPFTALDIGCGNGWVVRKFNQQKNCFQSAGVDGAEKMIERAKTADSRGLYVCEDILEWEPSKRFDVIFSMEVLYYLENPKEFIKKTFNDWLAHDGCFIFGIDHYLENKKSIDWPKRVGVNMNTQSIKFWINAMERAGFKNIKFWQTGAKEDWPGTLVVFGEK